MGVFITPKPGDVDRLQERVRELEAEVDGLSASPTAAERRDVARKALEKLAGYTWEHPSQGRFIARNALAALSARPTAAEQGEGVLRFIAVTASAARLRPQKKALLTVALTTIADAAERALATQPNEQEAGELTARVRQLVIAGRKLVYDHAADGFYTRGHGAEVGALDEALEAFAADVPWENAPGDDPAVFPCTPLASVKGNHSSDAGDMVLVPREPTEAMRIAWMKLEATAPKNGHATEAMWSAMLDAASPPLLQDRGEG